MGHGDGHITYRDGVAIAQVLCFSISLLFALSFRRTGRIGWFTIGVFSLLRLIGAGCLLGTINSHSDGLWAGVFVCESLGLILLIFTVLEMLERINKTVPLVQKYIFFLPQVLTWLDIAISIGGFVTVSKKDSGQLLPTAWSRASTGILALIFLYTVGISAFFFFKRCQYAKQETWLVWCVATCIPLLFVRVLYSVIFVITGDLFWNALKGNATLYLIMTFLVEVAFVAVCTGTISQTSPVTKEDSSGGGKEGQPKTQPFEEERLTNAV